MATKLWATEVFDASWQFTVATSRGITANSTHFKKGQDFDKSLVTSRRLRQMFDIRLVVRKAGSEQEAIAPKPPVVASPITPAVPPAGLGKQPSEPVHPYMVRKVRSDGKWYVCLKSNHSRVKHGPYDKEKEAQKKCDVMNKQYDHDNRKAA